MPSVFQHYHVVAGQDVEVRAGIGDAQAGGHAVFLGTTMCAQGEIEVHTSLGAGQDLVGRRLVVSSAAVDVQPGHDHVSVQVVLTGGVPAQLPIVQAADVPTNGAVSFLTIVEFVG